MVILLPLVINGPFPLASLFSLLRGTTFLFYYNGVWCVVWEPPPPGICWKWFPPSL